MWIGAIYVVGVAIGLVATDGGPAARVGLALAWPLGPLAFVATIAGLIVVAAIAFPAFGVILAAVLAGTWWVFR